MDLKFEVSALVRKPMKAVFDAIATGSTLSRYFPDASTGDLGPGTTVRWTFRSGESIQVRVVKFEPKERIELAWKAHNVPYETQVHIQLVEASKGTQVSVFESGWRDDQAGIDSSYQHCTGWTHMLMCLKAWLECGIDLRS